MCIRDRYYVDLSEQDVAEQLGISVGTVKSTASRALAALGAVSYTHLRAHETVLDLVCRLLLQNTTVGGLSRCGGGLTTCQYT